MGLKRHPPTFTDFCFSTNFI